MTGSRFGITVLVVLATMTFGTSVAQGVNFTAAKYSADIVGTQTSPKATSFGFENSTTAKCATVALVGEMTAASSSLTLSPGYAECTAFNFAEALIVPNECTFVLKAESGSVDTFSGKVEVRCPEGNKIQVIGGTCEVQIGAQAALGTVSYKNLTAAEPDEVEATFSITTLAYEKVIDGIACPLSGIGKKTNGALSGTIRIGAGDAITTEPFNFIVK